MKVLSSVMGEWERSLGTLRGNDDGWSGVVARGRISGCGRKGRGEKASFGLGVTFWSQEKGNFIRKGGDIF